MYSLLIRLMVLAALAQLGISIAEFRDCKSRACFARFDQASRNLLHVDWKPISVFVRPEKRASYRP